ncbi:patatin-like phospholipase family protein [Flavobacterium lipolyticum]|uniref:Patatin-like phospholipase family protein n=1 Tax=Flavobacterium lipolyticum TaxID=2893754 RepID=A0ABS8M5U2_9FLAO|nr:patatin-like phospholipase family protein [Flavobacterium sp. F-126]MCC9020141.1 patatin-like phospholipase family protein [Flavobacterium sp. F-126]
MDIVTDLTAEAISYLTLFQDILKKNSNNSFPREFLGRNSWSNLGKNSDRDYGIIEELTPSQIDEISDLVWHSPDNRNDEILIRIYLDTVYDLLEWLASNIAIKYKDKSASSELLLFRVPFFWRQQIRAMLYGEGFEERKKLAAVLRYMPVQVVQVICRQSNSAYEIRLYQFYTAIDKEYDYSSILNKADFSNHKAWWEKNREDALQYLTDDKLLLRKLLDKDSDSRSRIEFPLPFETFFNDELHEISKARKKKSEEWQASKTTDENFDIELPKKSVEEKNIHDPMLKAVDMKLVGLAFSGGGIRSATFNLGILQKLASLGVLDKIDYISTVSGGGYIGTWYTSWIKRSGSFSKVTDQLCPDKSSDPFADEVRPIRWLRMFSNYLSPNVGTMSPDAWTSGLTWLRNTLVNQAVLLLVLLTVLSFILDLYKGWEYLGEILRKVNTNNTRLFFLWNLGMLSVVAFIAASAMSSNYKISEKRKVARFSKKWNGFILTGIKDALPHLLISWSVICALLMSAFLINTDLYDVCPEGNPIKWLLLVISLPSFIALILVALKGNYGKRYDLIELGKANVVAKESSEVERRRLESEKWETGLKNWTVIVISSAVASVVVGLLFYLFWKNINFIALEFRTGLESIFGIELKLWDNAVFESKVKLLVSIPIVLEIFTLSIITRMAIMGKVFPDYRREWWGRTGAYLHRFMFFWILICFTALIMPDLWENFNVEDALIGIPITGGWAAIVAWGVKIAFTSKGDEDPKKFMGIMNKVAKIVPFIFMIGVLLIGSAIIELIRKTDENILGNLGISIGLLIITFLLSWRVGVNEFSLHHFYRNRLIRAFMGATRSREDRIKTANVFTGFDTDDDVLLSSMKVEDGYFGPYPILNTALNATVVSALDRQDRKAESFVFTPLYCGYDFSPTRPSTYYVDHVYEYGYRPTNRFSNVNGGPTIGTAMAISGAAVNPNWGYHSSAPMAFLLTMFNVRLGRWIGNTRLKRWKDSNPRFGLLYIIYDLIGKSDINMEYVSLSDGGHFDNMGLYELIRRRCHHIILGDGEQDQDIACEGLANAIRRCRIDFGVEIIFEDFKDITKRDGKSKEHIIKGEITYPGIKRKGTLIYIKAALTGDEPIDIREYALANPDFPQQSTADQFFDEAQFESYRKLGYHSISRKTELGFT